MDNPLKIREVNFDKPENYTINIIDANGKLIKSFDGYSTMGANEVNWNVTDTANNRVSVGNYFAIIQVGDRIQTISIIVQ